MPSPPRCRYIFVVGGVASSLGKGIIAASLGKLFQARGLRVTVVKIDPYLNSDAGTLSPHEHGECFVTADGGETDLDLGHYERFLARPLRKANSVTAGQVYAAVMAKERQGAYLGQTIQVVPHVTNEFCARIRACAPGCDAVIVEFGGTIGDMEAVPLLEALRSFRRAAAAHETAVVLVTLVPYLQAAKELKTKPTQQTVKLLRESGNTPDMIVCRSAKPLSAAIKEKIGFFCNVAPRDVVAGLDTAVVYNVPLLLHAEGLDGALAEKLQLEAPSGPAQQARLAQLQAELVVWRRFVSRVQQPPGGGSVRIGLVGKYSEIPDTYRSIREALVHAAAAVGVRAEVVAVRAGEEKEGEGPLADSAFAGFGGLLVAPGFGARGVEDKIRAAGYARRTGVPFFGICLGLQCAVVEFARNVAGLPGAASAEVEPDSENPVVCLMPGQTHGGPKGATMRLGRYPCALVGGDASRARAAYGRGAATVVERHRHRYEINSDYLPLFEERGLAVTGRNPDSGYVEIAELVDHPWFVGVQFHPEYKSYAVSPHPLFVAFVAAAGRNPISGFGRPPRVGVRQP